MPSQQLLNQFLQLLQASKSFQLLSNDEQNILRQDFTKASDEQLQQAIVALKSNTEIMANSKTELQEKEKKRSDIALHLKNSLQEVEKEELQDDIAQDQQESAKAAEDYIQEIENIPSTTTQKRKKFLGVF